MNWVRRYLHMLVNYLLEILKFQFRKSFRQDFPISLNMIYNIWFLQRLRSFEDSCFH
jgi:hypothetical protein